MNLIEILMLYEAASRAWMDDFQYTVNETRTILKIGKLDRTEVVDNPLFRSWLVKYDVLVRFIMGSSKRSRDDVVCALAILLEREGRDA